MSIQFDWRFDDEGNEKTPSVLSSWEPEKEATNTTQSSRIASSAMYIHARSGHHFHPAWLTASQRRLHAALARTRPWLCPDAQPESAAHSFDRWKQGGNIIRSLRIASLLRRFYARLKHRFHQMRLRLPSVSRLYPVLLRRPVTKCPVEAAIPNPAKPEPNRAGVWGLGDEILGKSPNPGGEILAFWARISLVRY